MPCPLTAATRVTPSTLPVIVGPLSDDPSQYRSLGYIIEETQRRITVSERGNAGLHGNPDGVSHFHRVQAVIVTAAV